MAHSQLVGCQPYLFTFLFGTEIMQGGPKLILLTIDSSNNENNNRNNNNNNNDNNNNSNNNSTLGCGHRNHFCAPSS